MRIRSTKPEFWRSERIAALSWEARLVLKGLESYVDDNGVGKDDVALIVGDVFPRDMLANPRETVARVSEAISELHRNGFIHRYEVDGTRLLYVSWWESVQRIDKPGKGRFPRPDGTLNYRESVIRESVASPRESVAPGTGEQGNRGTGEKDLRPPVFDVTPEGVREREPEEPSTGGTLVPLRPPRGGREVAARYNATAHSVEAHNIVRQYEHATGTPVPGQMLAEIAQRVDECLRSNVTPEQIAAGLAAWSESTVSAASQIPAFVHKAGASKRPGRTKPTARAMDAVAMAEQMIQEGLTRG